MNSEKDPIRSGTCLFVLSGFVRLDFSLKTTMSRDDFVAACWPVTPKRIEEDLRRLVEANYVDHQPDDKYALTNLGRIRALGTTSPEQRRAIEGIEDFGIVDRVPLLRTVYRSVAPAMMGALEKKAWNKLWAVHCERQRSGVARGIADEPLSILADAFREAIASDGPLSLSGSTTTPDAIPRDVNVRRGRSISEPHPTL